MLKFLRHDLNCGEVVVTFGASVRFAVPNDFIAVIVFDELIEEILRGSVVSEISSWAMAKIVLRLFQRR